MTGLVEEQHGPDINGDKETVPLCGHRGVLEEVLRHEQGRATCLRLDNVGNHDDLGNREGETYRYFEMREIRGTRKSGRR